MRSKTILAAMLHPLFNVNSCFASNGFDYQFYLSVSTQPPTVGAWF
jgi:hypothetical protein